MTIDDEELLIVLYTVHITPLSFTSNFLFLFHSFITSYHWFSGSERFWWMMNPFLSEQKIFAFLNNNLYLVTHISLTLIDLKSQIECIQEKVNKQQCWNDDNNNLHHSRRIGFLFVYILRVVMIHGYIQARGVSELTPFIKTKTIFDPSLYFTLIYI